MRDKCINHVILSGIYTAVTQKLLEHSSPDLTNKVYANVDHVLQHAVDQIQVGEWIWAHFNCVSDAPNLHQHGTRLINQKSIAPDHWRSDSNSFG